MTNMFKKSLVALALAGVSTGAMADVLSEVTSPVLASEYVSSADAGETPSTVEATFTVGIDANYANNDTAVVAFSGVVPNEISVAAGGAFAGACGTEPAGTANIISNVNQETGEAVLRFTNIVGDSTGCTFELTATYDAADVSANGSVSYQARLGNSSTLIGAKGEIDNLVSVYSQFDALRAASNLNRQIDVGTERQQFAEVEGDSTSVQGVFNIVDGLPDGVTFSQGVTFDEVTHTLTGNFSWLLDEEGEILDDATSVVTARCNPALDGDGVADLSTGSAPVTDSVSVTADSYTFACDVAGPGAVGFDVTDSELRIPAQSFALSSTVAYTGDNEGTKALSEINAGAWTLNGSQVYISYLPFGSGLTQVINLTNRSTQDGDVSVIAYDEAGREFDLGVIATSRSGSIARLARNVYDALQEETSYNIGGSTTRRFAFEVTTNAPAGEVEIYSAYNSSTAPGARIVVNSSNGAN